MVGPSRGSGRVTSDFRGIGSVAPRAGRAVREAGGDPEGPVWKRDVGTKLRWVPRLTPGPSEGGPKFRPRRWRVVLRRVGMFRV